MPSEKPSYSDAEGSQPTSPINALPAELHAEILSYLPWRSHLICMGVCTTWREILRDYKFQGKRYNTNTDPRVHHLFSTAGQPDRLGQFLKIIYQEGKVVSVKEAASKEIISEIKVAEGEQAIWGLELWKHPILDDPLFLPNADNATVGVGSSDKGNCEKLEEMALIALWVDTDADKMENMRFNRWEFKQNPEVKKMKVSEFITLVGNFVAEAGFFLGYKGKIPIELVNLELGQSRLHFGAGIRVKYHDGKKAIL
ncbi:hypothetical protein H072_3137 [Dactylellina haptotyla CBS 200.50]|uniref:F-box domain-containing protein n=1 Tax=Dactylellina haptotyla (strain CBS 200.50) TaxID=1284197 RepID=S8AIU4_DACHA|nr:hypothetical protein H072_3137 [Dactylellina haptotyla CBS 200.50]